MKLKELLKVKGLNTQHGGNVGTRPPKFPLIRRISDLSGGGKRLAARMAGTRPGLPWIVQNRLPATRDSGISQ